ncbi:hypothetical protein ABH922_004555 [Rhodococcus sp. 27YEA15]|uniref:hypothetical protein n=1 Tax=Rhodococcus sp. 27YEA15 TaxID=3156259 RepID=UPI003C7E9A1C
MSAVYPGRPEVLANAVWSALTRPQMRLTGRERAGSTIPACDFVVAGYRRSQ